MQIQIADDFMKVVDKQSLLILVIKGDEILIRSELGCMSNDMIHHKPAQGISVGADYVTQVITPVWNGKNY